MGNAPDVQAYYAKEQVRVLKWKLELFRAALKGNTNPKRSMWLEARISELVTVLFERTGTRY